jgi:hypothetical protein
MKISRDPRIIGAWLVGAVSLIIYTLTMAPTVAFWDVGEFITTAYTLGIPHPPGAPTFVLLGRLFTMVPSPFGVAAEVNFISVLSSALTTLLLYGIILEVLHLWNDDEKHWAGQNRILQVVAAATGAFAYAFSHSAWFNAVEAEVYGLSICVTALALWLALRHLRDVEKKRGASLLLLVAYILGIGAGNHLLALLTIPSIVVLLWYFDRQVLKRADLWLGALVLFAAGYSLYTLLLIRSGLDPVIDMNNPETWDAFMQFLKRRQYGTESMLAAMFTRKADFWSYQVDYHFLRYFRSQFWIPFYILALFGAMVNLWRDKRTFFANSALWVIMGFGLVIYLNMPDPQPRNRDYIYVGCYFATAIWIGTGMFGLANFMRELLPGDEESASAFPERLTVITICLLGLFLVGTQTVRNYHSHDRTDDYISWDYGYNILQSCEEDAILMTNGDNDTYPLWYLQIVEGIRPDIRVVNLSLLNTAWYIKELRDREPSVPILYNDSQVEMVLGLMQVPADTTLQIAGISWPLRRGQILRTQDRMTAHIVNANNWRKPVYFAITVPMENQAGFERSVTLEGFTFRLVPSPDLVNVDRAVSNLKEVFQYRGILDPAVYKDENASSLLQNYSVVFRETASALVQRGQAQQAWDLLEWGSERIDYTAPRYRAHRARIALANGDTTMAQQILEEVLDEVPLDRDRVAAYIRLTYSYALQGRFDEAARVLEKWLMQQPGDQNAQQWLEELREGRISEGLHQIGAIFWR